MLMKPVLSPSRLRRTVPMTSGFTSRTIRQSYDEWYAHFCSPITDTKKRRMIHSSGHEWEHLSPHCGLQTRLCCLKWAC